MANVVTVTIPNTIIEENAFANLFSSVFNSYPPNSQIDLVIELGPGTVLNANAFSGGSGLPNGIQISSASINFVGFSSTSDSITIGSNAFSGLPISQIILPAQTILQANAFQNLPSLAVFDASQVVNPIVTNGLNLSRSTTTSLSLVMPSSSSVTYQSGAVVLPPTSAGNTSTLIFNGAMPSTSELNQMFVTNAATTSPIQISINFTSTSGVTQAQINALNTQLTQGTNVPTAVSYTQALNVVQGNISPSDVTGITITSINQFAGDYFDYCVIAPKTANNAINQCVITGLTADAIKLGTTNVPIPNAIKAANVEYNVINIAARMQLLNNDAVPQTFFIIDNYSDPSDVSLPRQMQLVAIFQKNNAGTTNDSFRPSLVCNGTIRNSNNVITITGSRGTADSFCKGYNAAGSSVLTDLLATNPAIGSVVALHDTNAMVNSVSIAQISFPTSDTFVVTFNPVTVSGCFESYRPTGGLTVDFTTIANKSGVSMNSFSTAISALIAHNTELVNVLSQIRSHSLPAAIVSAAPSLPTVVSISNELAALAQSNFSDSLNLWGNLSIAYNTNGYLNYLNLLTTYVNAVVAQAGTQGTSDYLVVLSAFQLYQTVLSTKKELVNTQLMNLGANSGIFYRDVVSQYFQTRLSIGIQAFKNCSGLTQLVNFEFLHNMHRINDEVFNACGAINHPIIIPSNVISIGESAFKGCIDSTGIDIQNSFALRTIGVSAFEGCINASGSLSFSSAIGAIASVEYISDRAFYGCESLTDHLYFPKGMKYIGVSAFANCSSLNGTIVFPINPNFTVIQELAFAGCNNLTGISTNTGNGTSLQYLASYGPTLAGNVPNGLIVPPNVTRIGKKAFLNCSKFAGELFLQTSSVQDIGESAFSGCTSFTSLVLPNISVINNETFKGCTGIKQLTIPSTVTKILDGAFSGCNKIENIPNLENVNYIGIEAFSTCGAMKGALVLGSNLNILGSKAFFDCLFLTSVTFLGDPTMGLNESSLIFGVTTASNTPFYVNVFTENGWDGSSVASVTSKVVINTAFRGYVQSGAKSLVQMSFIDFNTYLKNAVSRNITINNYQSFNVYDNTGTAGINVKVSIPVNGFAWNDVYIPRTLKGDSIAAAQNNIVQASVLQEQITSLVYPKVDAIQSDTVTMQFRLNNLLREFDGRTLAVKVAAVGNAPIELVVAATANANSTTTEWYGVHSDKLYYASASGVASSLVTNLNLFVASADAALVNYNNKVISVDFAGNIVVSNAQPIGYGSINTVNAVLYTDEAVTTARTGKGYTILAGVYDKLYIDTLVAPAGVYFVANASIGGTISSANKYICNVIYVNEDGSVELPSSQNVKITANVTTNVDNEAQGYYFVQESQQPVGANTVYSLKYKPNGAPAVVAGTGYYYVKSSDLRKFNDAVIFVLPNNGGVLEGSHNSNNSSNMFGVSGAIATLDQYATAINSESIPLYDTNVNVSNLTYCMNVILPLNTAKYMNSTDSFKQKFDSCAVNNTLLVNQVGTTSSMYAAIHSCAKGPAFLTNVATLNDQFNLAQSNGILTKRNAIMDDTNAKYNIALSTLQTLVSGQIAQNKPGLYGIQKETLTNSTLGIYQFQRSNIYNSNALTASVDNFSNDLSTYITTQIKQFIKEILFMQYDLPASVADYDAVLINSIKNSSKFVVSPTSIQPAPSMTYNNLSVQQRALFDYTVSVLRFWLLSSGSGAVAGSSASGLMGWGNILATPGTGLYSVARGTGTNATEINEMTKNNLLTWAEAAIFPYFGTVSIYNQFAANNLIPTLAQIRTSISAYETARASQAADGPANIAAKAAYINAVKINTTPIAVINAVNVDTTPQTTAPTVALAPGKLLFNNANQTLATVLYISLQDGQATPANISFGGYVDTIVLNDSLTYKLKTIAKTDTHYELKVQHVSGTVPIVNAAVVKLDAYQTVSSPTLDKLALMNTHVWSKYNEDYSDSLDNNNIVTGIKTYIVKVKNLLIGYKNEMNTRLTELSDRLSNNASGLRKNVTDVNRSENILTISLQVVSITNGATIADLNGANMLVRELELFQNALINRKNSNLNATPTVDSLPSYESTWFNDRIAKYWNDALTIQPTVNDRINAYTIANVDFQVERYNRQQATIDLHIATLPPSTGEKLPLLTSSISTVALKIMKLIPAYLKDNTTQNQLASLISSRLTDYVYRRELAIDIATYASDEIAKATEALKLANNAYGKAAHKNYMAIIDLAISNAYYAGLSGEPALKTGATNQFQTLMQKWNVSSNKAAVFAQLKPLLFDFVYKTNDTVYTATNFPLKVSNKVVAWFGDDANSLPGFLYQVIADGLNRVTALTNTNDSVNGIPFTVYVLSPRAVTVNDVTTQVQLTLSSEPISVIQNVPTLVELVTSMSNPVVSNNLSSTLANPANLANAIVDAAAMSLVYNVASIGYRSVAETPAAALPSVDTSMEFNAIQSQPNDPIRYVIKLNGLYHHGHEQKSDLINSWAKVSTNQRAVVFYPGTIDQTQIPVNLSNIQTHANTLCDDASYVMLIEPIANSSDSAVSIYSYDVMGVNSGSLQAVGIFTPVQNTSIPISRFYKVNGALQKVANNPNNHPNGITIVGDIVISNVVKTIGINAFMNSTQITSLAFGAGTSNSVKIGSNAFQGCIGLPSINLGSTISSIDPGAFLNCTGAKFLTLPPEPSTFSVINHWAFLGCTNLGTNGNLLINRTITQINVQAFARCINLKCAQLNGGTTASSYLPIELQKIGMGAFLGCTGLTGSLNLNNQNVNGVFVSSLSVIGSAAFMGCTGLNGTLYLPINEAYQNVLPYTFSSMDAPIVKLSGLPHTITPTPSALPMVLNGVVVVTSNHRITTIEDCAFYKCSLLSSISVSNFVTKIGNSSFKFCSGLGGVFQVPASVVSIGDEAFRGCSKFAGLNFISTTITQSTTVKGISLGNSCFRDCTELVGSTLLVGNTLIVPNNVVSIGDSAFQGCVSIESVSVGSGLTNANSFGQLVFKDCTKLSRVSLAFSFLSRDVVGQSVVKYTVLPTPNPNNVQFNNSFIGCPALGVGVTNPPVGTIQIQSGATNWTPGRVLFFNGLTIVVNNRNITFYVKEFDKNITVVDPSKDKLQTDPIPITDAQANVYVKASDMRKAFRVSTDSYINATSQEAVDNDRLFFVLPEYFPKYLNVANAHVVQGGIESYNSSTYEQLVKDDVMRYYAMSLFNSADWVTLFANDTEMMENMVASSGLMSIVPNGDVDSLQKNLVNNGVLSNMMDQMNNVSYTNPNGNAKMVQSTNYPDNSNKWWALTDKVTPEQGNMCMKLFNLINSNDPGRIGSMVFNSTTPSELPFLAGDQIIFVFTLNENKVTLSPDQPSVVVRPRTYLIRISLVEDFETGSSSFMNHAQSLYRASPTNRNVLPVSGAYAADYMYSNYELHLAVKPNLLTETASSVYSKITQNSYEPVPMPPSLLPFTGWYYSYPANTQSIKLNFTPSDISASNVYRYNDMRYLSAYVYFPNIWSSMTALPNPNNFPQWVVTFTNGLTTATFKYKVGFLSENAETVNFLGQTVAFDHNNTHVQLLCPFDLTSVVSNFATSDLNVLLSGKTADGVQSGNINTIAGTDIWRQRNTQLSLVSGLRKNTNKEGPFTYPPVARGYQCIPMSTTTANGLNVNQVTINPPLSGTPTQQVNDMFASLTSSNTDFYLDSVSLEINMNNNDGFVPSIIVKSVEVVSKKYETYYLAPLNPN